MSEANGGASPDLPPDKKEFARLVGLVELVTALRRLSPFGLVAGFTKSAFMEMKSPAGRANFIGFVLALLVSLPLLVYTVLNQVLPDITLKYELFELTILPSKSSLGELLLLLGSMLLGPFLFGLCIQMFEAVHGDSDGGAGGG